MLHGGACGGSPVLRHLHRGQVNHMPSFFVVCLHQCCGAGAGGTKIIWDLEPEWIGIFLIITGISEVSYEDARIKKN